MRVQCKAAVMRRKAMVSVGCVIAMEQQMLQSNELE
jgi:hypothetical protein